MRLLYLNLANVSQSWGAVRVFLLYLKLASCQPELRECTPRATIFVFRFCEFRAGAAGVLFAYYLLYVKVAQPDPLREGYFCT